MAENAGKATVDLTADAEQLKRGLAEGEAAVARFADKAVAANARAAASTTGFVSAIAGINRAFSSSVGAVLSWIGKLGLVGTAIGLVVSGLQMVNNLLDAKKVKAREAAQELLDLAEKTSAAFAKINERLGPPKDEYDTMLAEAKAARDEAVKAENAHRLKNARTVRLEDHLERLALIEEQYQATVKAIEDEASRKVEIANRNRRLDAEAELRKKEAQDKEKQRAAELEEINRRMLDVAKQMADEQTRAAESAEKALEAQRAATREIIKQKTELRALQDQQRQGFDLSDLADDAAGTGAVLQLINSAIARGGGR